MCLSIKIKNIQHTTTALDLLTKLYEREFGPVNTTSGKPSLLGKEPTQPEKSIT